MKIKTAHFVISSTDQKSCPKPDRPEFAFIGRSNVGKSSLINMLVNQKHLAKTSSKPGKTQLINHFMINDSWYLVDLPGYGWAKVSKQLKSSWGPMIENYLLQRDNLKCIFVLIDIRVPPQPIDLNFLRWLGEKELPFVMVFTKADKLSKNKTQKALAAYKKQLSEHWEFMPHAVITSATDKVGREDVLTTIESIINDA